MKKANDQNEKPEYSGWTPVRVLINIPATDCYEGAYTYYFYFEALKWTYNPRLTSLKST